MKMIACFLLFATVVFAAAPTVDLSAPIPEVKLSNGRVLKNVTFVSYAATAIMAKWDGGRGTINYDQLTPETLSAIQHLRPNGAFGPVIKPVDVPPLSEPPSLAEIALSGQVFVTTKGGTNVKLGGVPVFVYALADFKAQYAWYTAALARTVEFHTSRARSYQKQQNFQSALVEIRAASQAKLKVLSELRVPSNATATDADGRFTVRHRCGEQFVIVAYGSRLTGDTTEYYRWFVPSSDIRESANVLLHNDNMAP